MFIRRQIIKQIVEANNLKVKDILTISNKKNLNYEEVIKLLAKRKNIDLLKSYKPMMRSTLEKFYDINRKVASFYTEQLLRESSSSNHAKSYLCYCSCLFVRYRLRSGR